MRALVSGAAGFLGSHLVDRLLARGFEVVGLDDLSTGRARNLAHLAREPRFRFVQRDACEPWSDAPPELDWVLHLACPASPPKYLARPLETMAVCADGTRRMLEIAERAGASFLLASTSEVYGDPEVHPQPESYVGRVNPVGPRSVYDEGKRFAEALTVAWHQARGVPVRIARIFNTYGPRMDPDDGRVVTSLAVSALRGRPMAVFGDGSQTRSLQYVDDLIDGFERLMAVDHGGPVNLGRPEEHTVLELARIIRELAGADVPIVHHPLPKDDPKQRRPDVRLARELLGWEARVPVREGLRATIEHLRGELGI